MLLQLEPLSQLQAFDKRHNAEKAFYLGTLQVKCIKKNSSDNPI